MARLDMVVGLLEQLAKAGLPTLIGTFYRSGGFTKFYQTFHTPIMGTGTWPWQDPSSVRNCGVSTTMRRPSAPEAFTARNAKKQPKPERYNMYQRLVTLLDQMIRVHEGLAGEAGDGSLRQLLCGQASEASPPSAMEPAPETPAPTQPVLEEPVNVAAPQATRTLPLQSLARPVEEVPVDCAPVIMMRGSRRL